MTELTAGNGRNAGRQHNWAHVGYSYSKDILAAYKSARDNSAEINQLQITSIDNSNLFQNNEHVM